jgi:hypothetical protein
MVIIKIRKDSRTFTNSGKDSRKFTNFSTLKVLSNTYVGSISGKSINRVSKIPINREKKLGRRTSLLVTSEGEEYTFFKNLTQKKGSEFGTRRRVTAMCVITGNIKKKRGESEEEGEGGEGRRRERREGLVQEGEQRQGGQATLTRKREREERAIFRYVGSK